MAAMPWCACMAAISAQMALAALPVAARAAANPKTTVLLPLDGTEQKSETYGRRGAERSLRTVVGENNTLDGTEIIYEIRFVEGMEDHIISDIRKMGNISIVNIVSYKGDIVG